MPCTALPYHAPTVPPASFRTSGERRFHPYVGAPALPHPHSSIRSLLREQGRASVSARVIGLGSEPRSARGDGGGGGGRGDRGLPISRLQAAAAPLLLLRRPVPPPTPAVGKADPAAAVVGDEADVLPGPGVKGEAEVPALQDEPLGGSQLDIGGLTFQGDVGGGFAGSGGAGSGTSGGGDGNKTLDRGINTAIVLGASTYALTKLLTVDQDYWQSGIYSNEKSEARILMLCFEGQL